MKTILTLMTASILFANPAQAQNRGFLRVKDERIVDGQGQEVLLRGMGLGGWMLQEGYMLGVRNEGTQHSIRARLTELVGPEDCEQFYQLWSRTTISVGPGGRIKKSTPTPAP